VRKTSPLQIYERMSVANMPLPETTKNLLEAYHEGLKAYHERKWDEGAASMEHATTFEPDVSGCRQYLERLRLSQVRLPEAKWNGVFVLHAKCGSPLKFADFFCKFCLKIGA
jgi:hypothetical protein